MIGPDNTYSSKMCVPSVQCVVQRNQMSFEPFADAIEETLEYVRNNPQHDVFGERFDAFAVQENANDTFMAHSRPFSS